MRTFFSVTACGLVLGLVGLAAAQTPAAAPSAQISSAAAADAAFEKYQQAIVLSRAKNRAFFAMLPTGSRVEDVSGAPTVVLPDQTKRPLSAEERPAFDQLIAAREAEEKAKRESTAADIFPEDAAAMDKARAKMATVLPPGASIQAKADGTWEVSERSGVKRAPNAQEQAVVAEWSAVFDQITARLRERQISQAPLRIVGEPALAGKTGQAKKWEPLIAQTMVFNHAARLNEALVRKNKTTISAGSTLFVATDNGVKHYCLPKDGGFMADVILCYHDSDGDGKLDRESNGGTPLNGVYMFASGFADRGAVMTPASFADIPYLDGHKQQVGVICTNINTNKKDGVTTAYFFVAVSAGKSWTQVGTDGTPVKLDAAGKGKLTLLGAEIEVTRIDNNNLSYTVVKGFPEQPYGLRKVVTYN